MPQATAYTLTELAELADVTPRTIRYYIGQGLLPSPGQVGPGAHYADAHLDRIRLIKLLQREHLPLAEIRARLSRMDDTQVAELAQSAPAYRQPSRSAVDYVRSVLREPAMAPMALMAPGIHARVADEPSETSPSPAPDRSQWDRIALSADVELHVRRPLTRHHNRLVDRLIATARKLFEEEPS